MVCINELEDEKLKLLKQRNAIDSKVKKIESNIEKMQSKCQHNNIDLIEAEGKDYYYSCAICKDCGHSWLQ